MPLPPTPNQPVKVMTKIDVLNESLLQESSKPFQETSGLQWEWEHYTNLRKIMDQIQTIEAGRDATDSLLSESSLNHSKTRLTAVEPFMEWLRLQQVDTRSFEIMDMESSGLGLVTKVSIKAGDQVLVIPEKIMMTTLNAKESKLKILAQRDPVLREMSNVLLSLFLLYEKFVSKENSFWKTYIDILPVSYDTILYFTLEEMQILKNSQNGFRESVRMYRNIVRQYAYFHGVFHRSNDSASRALKAVFTFRRYAWAASTAMTRQNSLKRADKEPDELCLIPLWDMCNHEATGQFANSYHPEEKHLACYASHDYEAGSEFFIFYGERTSVDHFVHGGFVPETYFSDIFKLEMGIGAHDPDLCRKRALLQQFSMKTRESFSVQPALLLAEAGDAASLPLKSLFAFIRIFQADRELLDQTEGISNVSFLSQPTSAVWKFLATRFHLLKISAQNSKLNVLKILCGGSGAEWKLSQRKKMILQLLQNEEKLLDMLAHCANDKLNQIS